MSYDATVGRWLSEDPIGFKAGDPNKYRYVGNMATFKTDPQGLEQARVTILFPEEAWYAEHCSMYKSPIFHERYDDAHFAVTEEEEIFEILGFDPDTVSVTISTANIYNEETPYVFLQGEDNNGNRLEYYGRFENNPNSGIGLQGYTFYRRWRDLQWAMTGPQKLTALQEIVPYYGLGAGSSFTKVTTAIPGVRPFRVPNRAINPNQAGKAGEILAETTARKTKLVINGRTRYPDGLTDEMLRETKNVKYQTCTRQLRDYLQYAEENDLVFELWVRKSTKISGPLQELIDNGSIILKYIPLSE